MSPVVGLVFAAAVLLLVAGVAKLGRPAATQVALRTAGLPSSRWAAQTLGASETVLAVTALAIGGRLGGAIIAVAYLGFAGFSALVRNRSRGQASCGCFGGDDTPVTALHVWLNVGLAGAGVATMVEPTEGIVGTMADTPWAGAPFLGLVLLLAWLVQIALTVLPALESAKNPPATNRSSEESTAGITTPIDITPKPEVPR